MGAAEPELIRSAQRGDDQAFGHLIEPHLNRVYRLALRTLGRPQEAEDAVQDALCKAWRALPRFRGEARFSTWLHRIVLHTCLDRARKPVVFLLEEEALAAAAPHDPEAEWQGLEVRHEVEQALSRLSAPYRAVLTLFYLEDLPLRDVAAILSLPVGTVKTHLHRARLALRAELEGTRGREGERVSNAKPG